MKFLVFNLLVVGAIAYLVLNSNSGFDVSGLSGIDRPPASGGSVPATSKPSQSERPPKMALSAEDIRSLVKEHMSNLARPVPEAPTPRRQTPASEPEAPVETAVTPDVPPPLPAPQPVAEKKPQVPPQTRPIPETKAEAKAPAAPEEAQTFMTPRERQRELAKLVRDMELLFADKLSD